MTLEQAQAAVEAWTPHAHDFASIKLLLEVVLIIEMIKLLRAATEKI